MQNLGMNFDENVATEKPKPEPSRLQRGMESRKNGQKTPAPQKQRGL